MVALLVGLSCISIGVEQYSTNSLSVVISGTLIGCGMYHCTEMKDAASDFITVDGISHLTSFKSNCSFVFVDSPFDSRYPLAEAPSHHFTTPAVLSEPLQPS